MRQPFTDSMLLLTSARLASYYIIIIRPPGLDLRSRPEGLRFTVGAIFLTVSELPLNVIFGTRNFDITFRLKINKNDPIFGPPKYPLKLMTSSKVHKNVTLRKTFPKN